MSTGLHLTTFDELTIKNDCKTITGFPSRKGEALLVYLLVEISAQRRESLLTLLWPRMPEKSARHNLRQVLYALRQTFPEVAAREGYETVPLILANRNIIQINPEALVDADFSQLDRLLRKTQRHGHPDLSHCKHCIQTLQKAVNLYAGEFLRDFYLEDSNPFEDWVEAVRETYRHQILDALETLADIFIQNQASEQAFQYINQQLDIDHLRECAHRQMMEAYWLSGRRVEALRHYHQYSQLLREELDIVPSQGMKDLYERIRTQSIPVQKSDFSVLDAVSPSSFPRHNLPHPLTSFTGRREELDEIANLVADHRLMTLTGTGGIGKTQLCLQVGRRLLDTFPDGVWLIELASLTDPMLVPQTIAYALGLWESPSQSFLDQLLDYLQTRHCLLILDNCEHLVDTVAQYIENILQACPEVKIMATGREILDVPGERAFLVPPLSFPKDDQILTIMDCEQYDAMCLFVERARQILPEFQVTPENLSPLVQICQRLDGIPLAIELAAARINLLTTKEIATRLEDRFNLLTEGSRTAPKRQQTLRATMDWSWNLLSEIEQALLARVSVFAGGMTLEAVEAICSGDGIEISEVLDVMMQLVNKSMVVAKRQQGQQTRYRLLETIRQYARERLATVGLEDQYRHRHLEYYKFLGEQAESALVGPDQVAWLKYLDQEIDNLRAALTWACETDLEAGLWIITNTLLFWVYSYTREGETWLSQFLTDADQLTLGIKAKAFRALSIFILSSTFDMDKAKEIAEESLALYQEMGDRKGIASCLGLLGSLVQQKGQMDRSLLLESLAIFRELGDQLGTAGVLLDLGNIDPYMLTEESIAYRDECERLFREIGHLVGIADILRIKGKIAVRIEDFDAGRQLFEESLAIWESLGLRRYNSWIFEQVGQLYLWLKEYEKARHYLEKGLLHSQKSGNKLQSMWEMVNLGYVLLRVGEFSQARSTLIECQRQFRDCNGLVGVVFSTEGLAILSVRQGKFGKAARLFGWSDATRQDIKDIRPPVEQAEIDPEIATIKKMIGKEAYAVAYAEGQSMTMEQAIELSINDE